MKIINTILYSVGSAIVGGAFGYLITKKIYTKKIAFEKERDEEERTKISESLRNYYTENFIRKTDPLEDARKNNKENPTSSDESNTTTSSTLVTKGKEMKEYTNYTKRYLSTKPDKNMIKKQHTPDKDVDVPYIVSDEPEIFSERDLRTYSWYEDDKFADDNFKIVSDPYEKFGKENLEKAINDNLDEVYIRNPKLGQVYHIIREDIPYNLAAGKYTHLNSEPDEYDYEEDYEEYAEQYDPE